ncbi:PHP domain-like protein [Xylona heveae TC161]|uniref:PHP domain-like protein n=1 Tax=Xylona heveae (strain CBS 132557 / TC161) TaxID=1328760 RepID=A0A165JDR0_XYLHT|nr:PHP domain-like protein [Xylona heveae TC161]KZF26104.1 PHP domain-like protein [Xylona heveae TC161]
MFYDLNVPWSADDPEVPRTLSFLHELGYNEVALTHTLSGKIPADVTCPIPKELPFSTPEDLTIHRRCTLVLSDPSQNHRLSALSNSYDILALRPTTDKCLQQACQTLECDLISLDLTVRHPFHFKFKTLSSALQRGIKFELCYSPGILAVDNNARRNLISNAIQIIRATRARGLVISSGATRSVGCRGPWDVINLAAVWGLGQEKGRDAVGREARSVVVAAQMKRRSYKGVIDVVDAGEKRAPKDQKNKKDGAQKRKADALQGGEAEAAKLAKPAPALSKREQKRQAKKAKLDATVGNNPIQQVTETAKG